MWVLYTSTPRTDPISRAAENHDRLWVLGNKARCKDMLHVEIKLLKLQEVNHAAHVDPGKSTCGASCKNSSYQMPLNYCILALQPAGTKLEQHVYSQKQEILDPNAMPIFFSGSK